MLKHYQNGLFANEQEDSQTNVKGHIGIINQIFPYNYFAELNLLKKKSKV